jgi:hypothetical protein
VVLRLKIERIDPHRGHPEKAEKEEENISKKLLKDHKRKREESISVA